MSCGEVASQVRCTNVSPCFLEGGGGGEERQTQRERETERDRERQRDRDRQRQTETDRDRQRDRESKQHASSVDNTLACSYERFIVPSRSKL